MQSTTMLFMTKNSVLSSVGCVKDRSSRRHTETLQGNPRLSRAANDDG